jgi:hypothetical protein
LWKIRTGKSVTALRLASLIDKTFNADTVTDRVFYKPSELLSALDDIGRRKEYGRCFIVDEAEEMISNTAWQSSMNRAIALTAATGGYRRACIFWVTPVLNYIDKRIRLLLNGWGMCQLNMRTGNKMSAGMRYYAIATNDIGDQIWRRKLSFWDNEDAKQIKASYYDVDLPDVEMLKRYVEHSNAAKDALNIRLRKTIENEENEILGEKTVAEFDTDLIVDQLRRNNFISKALNEKGKVAERQVNFILKKEMNKHVTARKVGEITMALNFGEKTKE